MHERLNLSVNNLSVGGCPFAHQRLDNNVYGGPNPGRKDRLYFRGYLDLKRGCSLCRVLIIFATFGGQDKQYFIFDDWL